MDTTRRSHRVERENLQFSFCNCHFAICNSRSAPRAFTLVELLVVITIIGILASLITVAAVGALKTARRTEIKVEINQIDEAFENYKNDITAFPPNCQTDAGGPLDETAVFNDLKRHLSQISSRPQEPDDLIRRLAGLASGGQQLAGGMSAGEAIVFWLGGFSSDPKYPISGEGGPSYNVSNISAADRRKADPIESRTWIFPFDVGRLGPRDDEGYFPAPASNANDPTGTRFIEYSVTINGQQQVRRINFWQYAPRKLQQPYLYFDTSRHPAAVLVGSTVVGPYDPPAATTLAASMALHVHAFKQQNPTYTHAQAGKVVPIEYINPDKFQIIHCGIDDAWGEEDFEKMSVHAVNSNDPNDYLLFPTGPFIGDIADTIVNFTTETKIEDAQQ